MQAFFHIFLTFFDIFLKKGVFFASFPVFLIKNGPELLNQIHGERTGFQTSEGGFRAEPLPFCVRPGRRKAPAGVRIPVISRFPSGKGKMPGN